jgi:hypothetical protein
MADADVSTQLIDAVKRGDEARVQALLRDKATLSVLDERDAKGFTALHYAAIGHKRISELLIAAGADASAKTATGMGLHDLRALGGLSSRDLLGPQAAEVVELQRLIEDQNQSRPAFDFDRGAGMGEIDDAQPESEIFIRRVKGPEAEEEGEGLIKQGEGQPKVPPKPGPKTLLGGLYVGNDAGEYTRVGQTKVALLDAGAQITLKNRELETFRAGVELAQRKGWAAIEVGGPKRYRQAAWLEGRAAGMAVQGYEPTEQDLKALEKRLADKDLQQSIAEGRPDVLAKSLEEAKMKTLTFKKNFVAPNYRDGQYAGMVFAESSHHVLVTVDGRDQTATALEKAKLTGTYYRQGELLKAQFKDGDLVAGRAQSRAAKVTR